MYNIWGKVIDCPFDGMCGKNGLSASVIAGNTEQLCGCA
jgi:hypothetical protein